MNTLADKVKELLGENAEVEVMVDDPEVAPVLDELNKARPRFELAQKHGIIVDLPGSGSKVIRISRVDSDNDMPVQSAKKRKKRAPSPKRHQHTYVAPHMAQDIMTVLSDKGSHVVWLVGPTQCGKTTVVKYIGKEMDMPVYQINCRGDMGSELFFGEKTVEVDPVTEQNQIVFQKGLVEQAMTEGLDENGNEVGRPAILFIDEIASCPAHVAHGINRLLESDDPRRTICLAEDGGRVVRSHSGFRIILAANTVGRGANSMEDAAYAAQMDALDISLLNRVAVTFRMGYDKAVEEHIMMEKMGDDRAVSLLVKFRDAIRDHIRAGQTTSPFSTAHVVHVSDMYRIFGSLGKAIYYVVFEMLLPEERAVYNETALAVLGEDIMEKHVQSGIDYM